MGHVFESFAAIHLFVQLLVGIIWLSSGAGKLRHPRRFHGALVDYQLLPSGLENAFKLSWILTYVLPLLEVGAGVGLISSVALLPATIVSIGLLGVFSGAIALNLLQGRSDLSCHCSGVLGEHRVSWWLVARNIVLIAGLLVLLIAPTDVLPLGSLVRLEGSSPLWLSVVFPVIVLVGVTLTIALVLRTFYRVVRIG